MAPQTAVTDAFIEWFRSQGATVDTDAMGLADIPGYGRGVVALKDLPVSTPVFESGSLCSSQWVHGHARKDIRCLPSLEISSYP